MVLWSTVEETDEWYGWEVDAGRQRKWITPHDPTVCLSVQNEIESTKRKKDEKMRVYCGSLFLDNLHETASTGGGLNLEGVVLLVDLAPDGGDEHVLDALAVLNQPSG